jgi:hypothetical protein
VRPAGPAAARHCPDQELVPHVDALLDWAGGRDYQRIVGVALGPAHERNGDAVVMHPRLPHSSGLNREGGIR